MISVKQSDLNGALADVGGATNTRSSLPVLSNILLVSQGDVLTLSATNLETSISATIPCRPVKLDGRINITVPASKLIDTVAAMGDGDITLEQNDKKVDLSVKLGRLGTVLKGIEAAEFPIIPQMVEAQAQFEVDLQAFNSLIASVSFAAASDQARPVLTALHIVLTPDPENNEAVLMMEAADGFRLARRAVAVPLPRGLESPLSLLIASRTLTLFKRIVGTPKAGEKLTLGLHKNAVILAAQNIMFTVTPLEGQYPDLTPVLPKTYKFQYRLNKEGFVQALALAEIIAAEASHTVRLEGKSGTPGTLTLSAVSAESGVNDSEIDCLEASGGSSRVAFNAKYLLEAVAPLTGDELILGLGEETSPGSLLPVAPGEQHRDWQYVMMPMKFN